MVLLKTKDEMNITCTATLLRKEITNIQWEREQSRLELKVYFNKGLYFYLRVLFLLILNLGGISYLLFWYTLIYFQHDSISIQKIYLTFSLLSPTCSVLDSFHY